MSKIDEVMKAWQEDHQKVSWQDLQTLKAENDTLRAQLSEKSIGQGVRVAWKHDCAVLLANDVELWIDACPHCGKPRHHPASEQKPLTDERTKAILFDHAISKGLLTVHSERMNSHDPATRCSWLEGHAKACDISNEAAHNIGEKK